MRRSLLAGAEPRLGGGGVEGEPVPGGRHVGREPGHRPLPLGHRHRERPPLRLALQSESAAPAHPEDHFEQPQQSPIAVLRPDEYDTTILSEKYKKQGEGAVILEFRGAVFPPGGTPVHFYNRDHHSLHSCRHFVQRVALARIADLVDFKMRVVCSK